MVQLYLAYHAQLRQMAKGVQCLEVFGASNRSWTLNLLGANATLHLGTLPHPERSHSKLWTQGGYWSYFPKIATNLSVVPDLLLILYNLPGRGRTTFFHPVPVGEQTEHRGTETGNWVGLTAVQEMPNLGHWHPNRAKLQSTQLGVDPLLVELK